MGKGKGWIGIVLTAVSALTGVVGGILGYSGHVAAQQALCQTQRLDARKLLDEAYDLMGGGRANATSLRSRARITVEMQRCMEEARRKIQEGCKAKYFRKNRKKT